ncbi:MAG: c-type cytochrome [Pseudomonadota bacterium]|nr:c-type cytochrome [Pseudomonadota bacterium]
MRPHRLPLTAAIVGTVALAWSALAAAPDAPAAATTADPALVQRGAVLASLGDCIVCHTTPEGRAYAGGRALHTPFGLIYGTNITPDVDTGIGRYTEADFVRAMRQGLGRDGRQLYPAFPYEHFRYITDDDLHALYAFIMTREAVAARTPENDLRFPYNVRALIAAWKLMFLRDPERSAGGQPNVMSDRGAYLVAGLGHCGACHTPRNWLGGEQRQRSLSGGDAEGWHAPALEASTRVAVPWTVDTLVSYLRGNVVPDHEVAGGPMLPVVRNLSGVPEEEVRAIASYIVSLQKPAADATQPPREPGAQANAAATARGSGNEGPLASEPGAVIWRGACAGCHGPGRDIPEGALRLGLSTTARAATARNFVQIVLQGIQPPDGEPGAWMPSFAGSFTDAQLADLANYVRARFGGGPAWQDVEGVVKNVRRNPEGP